MVTLRSLELWEAGYPVLLDGEQPAEDILYWKQVAQASNYQEALVLLAKLKEIRSYNIARDEVEFIALIDFLVNSID